LGAGHGFGCEVRVGEFVVCYVGFESMLWAYPG
jgi:hypothetical protein